MKLLTPFILLVFAYSAYSLPPEQAQAFGGNSPPVPPRREAPPRLETLPRHEVTASRPAADPCQGPELDLRAPGYSMEKLVHLYQKGPICHSYVAAQLMDAWRFSHSLPVAQYSCTSAPDLARMTHTKHGGLACFVVNQIHGAAHVCAGGCPAGFPLDHSATPPRPPEIKQCVMPADAPVASSVTGLVPAIQDQCRPHRDGFAPLSSCYGPGQPGNVPRCDVDYFEPDATSKRAMYGAINNLFSHDNPQPVGIAYCTAVLVDRHAHEARSGGCSTRGSHASILIGRKWEGGKCKFLLRNTWGTQYDYAWPQDRHDVWIDSDELVLNTFGIQSLDK